jgi:hypothetical protein
MFRSPFALLGYSLLFGLFLLVVPLLNTLAHAAGLNDTGQTTCYDDTQAVTPEPSTHPQQDCTIGRDAG